MQRDERDLLEVLKAELEFLNSGGYARVAGSSWRPAYIFEDSPACMNHDYEVNPGSCKDCVLLQLVPPQSRADRHPCRHIPLNAAGETLDMLYQYGDDREIEQTVRNWLESAIAKLEEHRETLVHTEAVPSRGQDGQRGTALREKAKCANPACPTTFDWRNGGKLFRFDESPDEISQTNANEPRAGVHSVRHYWLCERCSHVYTLVYDEGQGIVLRLAWPALLAEEPAEKLAAG